MNDSKVYCDFIRFYLTRYLDEVGIPEDIDHESYNKVIKLLYPNVPFDALNLLDPDDWKGINIELSNMIPKKYDVRYLLAMVFGYRSEKEQQNLESTLKKILADHNEALMPQLRYKDTVLAYH